MAMAVDGTNEKIASSIVLWRIENISCWDPLVHGWYISSPQFVLSHTGARLWSLGLFPKGKSENHQNLSMNIYSFYNFQVPMKYEWSLLDGNVSPLVTRRNQSNSVVGYLDLTEGPSHEDVFTINKSSFLPNDILTVGLRAWKLNDDFYSSDYIVAVTRFNAAEESIEWRIEGFSCLQLDQEVTTPLTLDFPDKQEVFTLKIALRGSSLDDSELNFEILAENPSAQCLKINLSVLFNEKKTTICRQTHEFRYASSKQTCIVNKFSYLNRLFPRWVTREYILEKKSEWLCGDSFTLLCKFNSHLNGTVQYIETSGCGSLTDFPKNSSSAAKNEDGKIKQSKPNPRSVVFNVSKGINQTSQQSTEHTNTSQRSTDSVATLQEDFLSLYADHTLSDFQLRSGDVRFPVHKMVLCARSPVFRAMFCGNMKEANSTFLDIPDMDVHSLGRMLTFLYAGTLDDLQWESAAKLYYAADKYQVTTLKHECSSVLRSSITVANVSELLELADRHQDQELTSFVHEFIVHHYDEIVLSEEWNEFLKRSSFFAGNTMKNVYKRKLQMEGKLF